MHSGAHSEVSVRPWINEVCAHLGALHMSTQGWIAQHNIGHHTHTGLFGRDPDLYHFGVGSHLGIPGFRINKSSRPLRNSWCMGLIPRAIWWRLGLVFRILMTTFGPSYVYDLMTFFMFGRAFHGIVPYPDVDRRWVVRHFGLRFALLWLVCWYPALRAFLSAATLTWGLFKGSCSLLVPYALHGALYYLNTQLSHVQECCFTHPEDDSGERVGPGRSVRRKEWCIHEIDHTFDYCTSSPWITTFAIGLNNQICHHLFPQVHWGHYPQLSCLLQKVCKKHGVEYRATNSWLKAISMHFDWIYKVNVTEADVYNMPPVRHTTYRTLLWLGGESQQSKSGFDSWYAVQKECYGLNMTKQDCLKPKMWWSSNRQKKD